MLESGKLKLNQNYYFIEEMVGNALKTITPMLGEGKVETKIEASLPALWADGLLLEQVLVNLLENAVKYTQKDAKIIISAHTYRNNQLQIKVEDNGPGIPKGQEQRIFDKFITAENEAERRGTGLGLAICRGIIREHGGTITAKNSVHGAVFIITLPLGERPVEEIEEI